MTIFKMELRHSFKGFLLWLVLFLGLIFGFAALYPQMFTPEMKDSIQQMFEGFSPALLKVFNLQLTGPASLLQATGFFAYYFQYLFLAACVYAILSGSTSLVSEETQGTIEYLYTQPVTRREILLAKLTARWMWLTLFWGSSLLCSIGSFFLFQQKGDSSSTIVTEISRVMAVDYLVLVFFLALGFLISTLLFFSKSSTTVGLAIVFGFYLLGIFGGLYDKLSWLSKWSPVHMGLPANIMENGVANTGWLALAAIFCIGAALLIYQRKDLRC